MFEPPAYGSFPDVLWTTSDLCDAYLPDEAWGVQVVQQALRSFGGHHWYFGEVVTACAPPDASLSLAPILSSPGHARVLMVEAHADGRHAVFGDRMAGLAVQNGWAGVIVHGYVRDAEKLARLPLGVHALGVRPNRAASMLPVSPGGDFELFSAAVAPGRWVYVDADGIILMHHRHTCKSAS